jgi:hypothetical protein
LLLQKREDDARLSFPVEELFFQDRLRKRAAWEEDGSLDLSDWPLTDPDLGRLAEVKEHGSLRSLTLRGCGHVGLAGLEQLREMTSCTSLDLGRCLRVDDACCEHIRRLVSVDKAA